MSWEKLADEIAVTPTRRSRRRGAVTSLVGIASIPSEIQVDVGASGVSIPMRYDASYAPSIGDEVIVDWLDGDPYVAGKLA